MPPTFGQKVYSFYTHLEYTRKLPPGVTVMNPYRDLRVQKLVRSFLNAFFPDTGKRIPVFGINPGRLGSGTTGVMFTDPVALETFCGIPNDLPKKREPSSVFVYEFVQHMGGPGKFYRDFFLTAVSPLGFLKNGKNYNFYDHARLARDIKPFLAASLQSHIDFGARRHAVIVLGAGENQNAFNGLNREFQFFKNVYVLEHPRFIMQYRYKERQDYLRKYRRVFTQALQE